MNEGSNSYANDEGDGGADVDSSYGPEPDAEFGCLGRHIERVICCERNPGYSP